MKDTITWFDMPTTNFERALKFYSTILGKELHVAEFMGKTMAFFPMEGKEGVGGDLIPPDPTFKPSSQGTRVYLNCIGKLDEVIGRVEKAGGNKTTSPQPPVLRT